jgi:dihydrofolate reductase
MFALNMRSVKEIQARRMKKSRGLVSISPGLIRRPGMRNLIVHQFITLDGVIQAPGGPDEDRDGGFTHGGWTMPYWHDDIGATFGAIMQDVDAFLLARRTYLTHAEAFEPLPAGDAFGDLMNPPAKYVVSKTLEKPIWRNTTIIRDDVVAAVRALKAAPGKSIIVDGSSQLCHTLLEHDLVDELYLTTYPLTLGTGKRLFPATGHAAHRFSLASSKAYPTGVLGLHFTRTH